MGAPLLIEQSLGVNKCIFEFIADLFCPPTSSHSSYPDRKELVRCIGLCHFVYFYHAKFVSLPTLDLSFTTPVLVSGNTDTAVCTVVRALASHQCGPGSIPELGVTCGLSLLLFLVLAPRVFSPGTPVFPFPQKPTFPNSNSIWFVSRNRRSSVTKLICFFY